MKEYRHYGHTAFDKDAFVKIRNICCSTKPEGGLWASGVEAKYGWKAWCSTSDFRECKEENSFTFTLAENAKVLHIASADDLELLPVVEDKITFNFPLWVFLNFEELSKTYDAIEVSLSSDARLCERLSNWDCDSILIMNPNVIIEV